MAGSLIDTVFERSGVGQGGVQGPFGGFVYLGQDAGVESLEVDLGGPVALDHVLLEHQDGVALGPLLEQRAGDVFGGVVSGVAGHAEGLALDQVRTASGATLGDGVAGGVVDGDDVIAVDDLGGNAVGGGAIGDVRDRHLLGEGGGVGVLVVVAEIDDGQLLDGGEVDPFVPVAAAGGAVAEVGEDDVGQAAVPESEGDAAGHGDARANGGDDGHQVEAEIAHVHVAIAAAGGPGGAAQILGEDATGLHAAHQERSHVAMGGTEPVLLFGEDGAADGDGLLAPSGIASAEDLPLAVELQLDPVLNLAHELQVVEQALAEVLANFGYHLSGSHG